MNGYIASVEGKQIEIHANTSYEAMKKAQATYTGRKKHPSIWVELVELAGEQVTTTITN